MVVLMLGFALVEDPENYREFSLQFAFVIPLYAKHGPVKILSKLYVHH